MSVEAYESMKDRLEPTGLYALGGSTAVDFELRAMAEGIDTAYDAVNELQRESFLSTAESYGLENRETVSGLDGTGTAEDRRAVLLALGAVTPRSFTKSALTQMLCGLGLETELAENTAGGALTVYFLKEPACGRAAAQKILEKFMPAHLTAVSDFSRVS